MVTEAITPLIAIITITNVPNVFVFGLTHSVEFLDEMVAFCTSAELVAHPLEVIGEMVAFCATVEEAIVTELEVTQLGTKWRPFSIKRNCFKQRTVYISAMQNVDISSL